MGGGLAVGLAAALGALLAALFGFVVLIGAAAGSHLPEKRFSCLIRKQLLWCAGGGAVLGALAAIMFESA